MQEVEEVSAERIKELDQLLKSGIFFHWFYYENSLYNFLSILESYLILRTESNV